MLRITAIAERGMALLIYLIRHGETVYNAEKRYQGIQDIPLSPEGRAALRKADIMPETVYTSPLSRALDTARILFPQARLIPAQDLREMNFGRFEGRNFIEMEHDADYRAWVESGCTGRCPDGESKEEFSNRVCAAFERLVNMALETAAPLLVIVAHGGTQMAAMERYAYPRRDYYAWRAGNGAGYVLEASRWRNERLLDLTGEVNYTKD